MQSCSVISHPAHYNTFACYGAEQGCLIFVAAELSYFPIANPRVAVACVQLTEHSSAEAVNAFPAGEVYCKLRKRIATSSQQT